MLSNKSRIIPFLLGMVPVIMLAYFGFIFIVPAEAQTAGSVSDQCHVTSRCRISGATCSSDAECKSSGDACVFNAIKLNYSIPGVTEMVTDKDGVKRPYVQNMACFIADIYRYLAGVAGILAVVMMIYGGVKYTVSFGNPSKLQDARETISSAMIGLALVLGSYVILNFINPGLTSLKVPGLTPIQKNELSDNNGYHGMKICSQGAIKNIACGGVWHSGKEDQCTVVGKCNNEAALCTLFVGNEDNKPYAVCMDSLPVRYKDVDYDAHAKSDEFCGTIIFDDGVFIDSILIGTKCNDTDKACGIDIEDTIPHLYATGEQRPPGLEDEKYIGYYPKALCF